MSALPARSNVCPRQTKADLIQAFIVQVLHRVERKQHCAPYLAALGLLLNRTPLYAGPETVVPAALVARAYAAFQNFDWAEPELLELHTLFLRAARVVDDRNLDVAMSLRNEIARKLERAGIAPIRTATIRAFTPVGRVDCASLYRRVAASRPGARRRPDLKGHQSLRRLRFFGQSDKLRADRSKEA